MSLLVLAQRQHYPGRNYRLPDIESKAAFQRRGGHKPSQGELTPQDIIAKNAIRDLTAQLQADGRLAWDVPPGQWTVPRLGHTSTGAQNAPAPASGRGLECDKLSEAGIEAAFAGMMAKLAAGTGAPARRPAGGLVATHIDSWENGSQNWTANMCVELCDRHGYDPLPYLPVFTGRVVGYLRDSQERG